MARPSSFDYVVVAGGGGGAGGINGGHTIGGAGGGAGGMWESSHPFNPGDYLVTIGGGGAGGPAGDFDANNNVGGYGANTSISGVVSVAGGAPGGGYAGAVYGGGSGGGGSFVANGGAGTSGQGNAGGGSPPATGGDYYPSGGGGGAGAAGGVGVVDARGGNGGGGRASAITGGVYAGGGGAGFASQPGAGGSGGGGAGSGGYGSAAAGAANTGGGGGGGTSQSYVSGPGGSGVAYIRYAGPPICSGGGVWESGGYSYHGFGSTAWFSIPAPPAAPVVSSCSPTQGVVAGGTAVTVYGSGFTGGAGMAGVSAVHFGGVAATSVSVVNANTLTCVAPAHAAGLVSIVAYAEVGSGTGTNLYNYLAVPTVTGCTPNSGPMIGGGEVTVSGSGFTSVSSVTFGGVAAINVSVASVNSLTCRVPAHAAGLVNIVVTAGGGTGTGVGLYNYLGGGLGFTMPLPF